MKAILLTFFSRFSKVQKRSNSLSKQVTNWNMGKAWFLMTFDFLCRDSSQVLGIKIDRNCMTRVRNRSGVVLLITLKVKLITQLRLIAWTLVLLNMKPIKSPSDLFCEECRQNVQQIINSVDSIDSKMKEGNLRSLLFCKFEF